ncbi:hypothetical protein ACFLXI_06720 [Chloroflexota bacterium]
MIYVSGKLNQPLAAVAFLLTINSTVSLGVAFVAGPIADRFGRKWILIVSLFGNGLIYLLMGQATKHLARCSINGISRRFELYVLRACSPGSTISGKLGRINSCAYSESTQVIKISA